VRSLQWTDEHSVFVPEIDDEHRALFEISQELRRAVLNGESQARLEFLSGRVAIRIASHFQHEERLMRLSRYSAMNWHERQHQTARGLLAVLTDSMRGSGGESVLNALEALTGWMLDHVTVADRMLGAHLRNYWRERIAS
jgi:hemerythrin-like metal-binding protein